LLGVIHDDLGDVGGDLLDLRGGADLHQVDIPDRVISAWYGSIPPDVPELLLILFVFGDGKISD
jgi:hypothetical protein